MPGVSFEDANVAEPGVLPCQHAVAVIRILHDIVWVIIVAEVKRASYDPCMAVVLVLVEPLMGFINDENRKNK